MLFYILCCKLTRNVINNYDDDDDVLESRKMYFWKALTLLFGSDMFANS